MTIINNKEIVQLAPMYLVTITVNEKEVQGKIEFTTNGMRDEIVFDPLNVLADLSYTKEKILLPDEKILASQYDYEYAFSQRMEVFDVNQYTQFVMCIKKLLKYIEEQKPKKNELGPKYVDMLRSYYHISCEFIPFDEIEPAYGLSPVLPELSSFFSKIDSYIESCQNFKYACYDLADIIYAILHFLAFNRYKICKCAHCGRYFATQSNKVKYCTRKSPYPNFTRYNCEQAVRYIHQVFTREHNRIYNNLHSIYKDKPEKLDAFQNESNDAKDKVKENPSIENIQKWESVLDKGKWYTKQIVRNVGEKEIVQNVSLK